MIRTLLIIALLYVIFFHIPRTIRRSMSRPSTDYRQAANNTKQKGGTTIIRVEEPKPRILDTSDVSDAHFEEVEE